MNTILTDRIRQFAFGTTATATACAVGTLNLVFAVVTLVRDSSVAQTVVVEGLSVPTTILGILLLQCALAHAVGRGFGKVSTMRSSAAALPWIAVLSLISSGVALSNIQTLLAPNYTFAIGSVAMVKPPVVVVLVYLACAFISFGFTFVNVKQYREAPMEAGRFSVSASWMLTGFFLALGVWTVI